jgi:hypothetical protein
MSFFQVLEQKRDRLLSRRTRRAFVVVVVDMMLELRI